MEPVGRGVLREGRQEVRILQVENRNYDMADIVLSTLSQPQQRYIKYPRNSISTVPMGGPPMNPITKYAYITFRWAGIVCRLLYYLAELPGNECEAVRALLEVGGELRAGGVVLGALPQQRGRRGRGGQRGNCKERCMSVVQNILRVFWIVF